MNFDSLKETISGLTLYDVKAGVRKVQNAVMNYTEMESKVREATNNEPWGASTTLMNEIANGTHNYQQLNEIMPMIYKRFTEKAAEEWRQIYKALQLLEYLVKNGSERVVDDARSHISILKMLRNFQYLDQNGKDQGINVRNRAKELAELLGDVERIRGERKKARGNRAKYGGVEGGSSFSSGGLGGSSRYGGFGSESGGGAGGYGGYSGGVYGDGGGFGGEERDVHDNIGATTSSKRRDRFEEYDEFDDGATPSASSTTRQSHAAPKRSAPPKAEPVKEKVADLFSFDDEPPAAVAQPSILAAPSYSAAAPAEDDDFDDFQSAAPPAAAAPAMNFAAPQPVSAPQAANLNGLVAMSSISPAPSQSSAFSSAFSPPPTSMGAAPMAPVGMSSNVGYQAAQPNYYTSVPTAAAAKANSGLTSPTASSTTTLSGTQANKGGAAKPATAGAFGSLWNQASVGERKATTPVAGPKLSSLAKEKASAGIWGTGAAGSASTASSTAAKPANGGQSLGNGLDDLLG